METRALIDEYLLDCEDRGLAMPTIADYAFTLAMLVSVCPKLPATVDHVNQVIRKMMRVGGTNKLKRKSPSTKWKYRKNLTAFSIWVEKRYGLRNPCQDLGRWNPPDTLPRYYTREEIDRIAAAVLTDIERALIALILDNGLRIGEVASLLKSRIKDGCVMVRGKRGGRRVPVSPEVIAMLKALGKGNVIWMGRKGRLNAGALAQICRNVIVRAGITGKGRGPHTLRHTFATWYLKRGGHLLKLKEILGHKHLTQTLVYLHLSGADVDEDHAQFSPFRQLGLFSQDGGPGSGPAGECQCDCGRLGCPGASANGASGPVDITSMSNDVRDITSGHGNPDPADNPELYGRHFYVKPLAQRSASMQRRIGEALTAFQRWRRQEGEDVGDDPWTEPPPPVEVLRAYLAKVALCGNSWQNFSYTALRLYLKEHRRPDLFRMVGTR